ncbi:hypothetical protein ACFWVP_03480 [Streptomyces sp. NPDC058637]|uniref:hypothetical protein n=1 Tax=Streptomyces sp. NPDC058637 TaxID=3346569 RepID=UPI0036579663
MTRLSGAPARGNGTALGDPDGPARSWPSSDTPLKGSRAVFGVRPHDPADAQRET